MIGVATRRFPPTSHAPEKRTARVKINFTAVEFERVLAEANRRGLTVQNLIRFALEQLSVAKT